MERENLCVNFLLQHTGDFSFAMGAVSTLMNECQDVIIENMTVNTNETTNVTKPTMPPALEEVFQHCVPTTVHSMENVSTVPVFVTKIIQRMIVQFQFIKGQPLLGAFAIKSCSYHVSCGVND